MDMKVLKIIYKGTCQEISVADGTEEKEIFLMMKRIFKIKEDIQDFFLQDSEGRIVILPKHLPNELSLFLYVRSFKDFLITLMSCKTKSEFPIRLTPLEAAIAIDRTEQIRKLLTAGANS